MNPLAPPPLRLAEAVGVLSLATDLSMGQPLEHGLRTTMLALRLAQAMGLSEDDQVTVYYTGLLHFAGCTAESEIDARFFGDEMTARPQMLRVSHGSRFELMAAAMRTAHQGSPPLTRAAMMARAAFGGIAEFRKWAASHCDVARILGGRMGLSEPVKQSLRHLYERWDGDGMPGDLRGPQIPLAVRLMQVAQDADVACQYGGIEVASGTLARWAGSGLDPEAVRVFLALGDEPYKGLDAPSIWDDVMAAEPGPQPEVTEDRLDACLSAIADFADLKSMWTTGHSRGVADLAERAASLAGLAAAEVITLRRAALVHDIGRVAVPVGVWGKPGPLTRGEHEQVRLHAYHSERVLEACPALRRLARLAGSHGERCDGSGYHRGSRAADLPAAAWLLAAADCYQAMREPRAHRPARSPQAAADELSAEGQAGRLPPDAVRAVLAAAGQQRSPVPRPRPAGLSERECEVLGLIARGMATKQVARQLGISPKTCDHHIQRLYRKTGLSTRAGATLFALEHGLVDPG
ncbi:MAG TPA: HD domain-containing phosphohydrolase [Streptosporangiaceae bacterium]|nr:HD domain-containing phosphohydrolase [Streptosporangiaceae bacterium]HEX5289682.1 HD domain-containing phosphohydrolase [Streptosporangiaceae bacterium]